MAATSASGFAPSSFVGSCRIRNAIVARSAPLSSSIFLAMAKGDIITDGAYGVGNAYASDFVQRGLDVVICNVRDCAAATGFIQAKFPNRR